MLNSPSSSFATHWPHSFFVLFMLVGPFFFAQNSAFADDREKLGEECYQILHDEDHSADEAAKRACVEQFAATRPTLVITPLRRTQEIDAAPASVELINAQELERSGADSLAEALRDVPGIEITDAGQAGLKRIRIRGEESRRVTILIDGQEFADEREVGTPLLIAPEMIERVEVVRGTGSVLHGSRAIGGVVNFITKKGGYHPVQGTVSSLYDSATEGYQLFGSLFGLLEGVEYRVAGTIAEHGDRNTPDGDIDNTEFENNSFSGYIGKEFDDHHLAISYDNYKSDSEVFVEPEVATTPPFLDFQIDAPKRDRSKLALFYDWQPRGETFEQLHVDGYYQRSEREFNTFSDLELDFGGGPFIRNSDVFNSSTLETIGLNAQADFKLNEAHHLIVGLEAKNDELEQDRRRELTERGEVRPTELVTDEAQQWSLEVFAQDKWTFFENWSLIYGARGYWIDSELEATTRPGLMLTSEDDQHAVGSVGLRYTGIEDVTLWTTWSQGYVTPSLINTATGAFAGPDYVSPNPDLDPETSNSFDVGGRISKDLFRVEASAFYTRARDYIDHVRCSATDVACIEPAVGRRDRVYINIDKVQSFGAEFSATLFPKEIVSPYANLSWIRRRFESEELRTYETGIPDVTSRVGIEVEKQLASKLRGWADFYLRTATESDELDDDELEHRAGWGTLNLSFGAAFGKKQQLKLIVELLNLGDKRYITSTENLPARGRSAIVKIVGNV